MKRNMFLLAAAAFALTAGKMNAHPLGATSESDHIQSAQAPVGNVFMLGKGKLGPVQIGQAISTLPSTVNGLYDKFTYKKEEHEDMDGLWTEEYVLFTKKGIEVFRADIANKRIVSFTLLEGSTFIKTEEGFHVGYSARALFTKKRMQWDTYFMGDVFATSGRYTYYINSSDLIQADVPERVSQIKPNAKITSILYK